MKHDDDATRLGPAIPTADETDRPPLTLPQLAELEDVPATAPMPTGLIEHLRLRYRPGPGQGPGPAELSAPKGYAPRLGPAVERTLVRGIIASGHALEAGESLELPTNVRVQEGSHRPAHLALRRIPRLLPAQTTDLGGLGPMTVRRWEVSGQDMGAWPWCTIGRIDAWSEGRWVSGGSAFLVGRNLLVTASHCMPWDHSGNCSIRFIPAHAPGKVPPFGETWVAEWRGNRRDSSWDVVTKADAKDYVVCRLDDPIGDICGWMDVRSFSDHRKYLRSGYMSAGYPSYANGQPVAEMDVRIRDVDGDNDGRELESAHFAGPGWSGGPLFAWFGDDLRAVGVLHGQEVEFVFPWYRTNLVFAGGKHLVNLVRYGQANWAP